MAGQKIFEHSDIPCNDFYSGGSTLGQCKNGVDWLMNNLHNCSLPDSGKSGFQLWLTECGQPVDAQCSGHINPSYFPELFQYQLGGGLYGDVSALFLWALTYYDGAPCNDWGAFYGVGGAPKTWIQNLSPYFPAYEPPPPAPPSETVFYSRGKLIIL